MLYSPLVPFEYEVARRWWTIPVGSQLPLVDGRTFQLVFPGSPGGSYGPDVRDAVLSTSPLLTHSHMVSASGDESRGIQRLVGDVEFHIRSSDWWAHHHDTDPRYNHVILHVILVYDDNKPTLRQDGISVPNCSLNDLALFSDNKIGEEHHWPCQHLLQELSQDEVDRLLLHAGLQRFEQKIEAFVVQLRAATPIGPHHLYDSCLFPSLAEGLAYGRDRALFRALGLRLLDPHVLLPEPLGHTDQPAPLDASRLHVLARMLERWHTPGIWLTLHAILQPSLEKSDVALNTTHSTLRTLFSDLGLSSDRTDILLCNVLFPFATAVALLEQDTHLETRAQQLYLSHPGLSSNRITRMMSTQLRLNHPPRGSCRQQGLHYVYQETCRAKLCNLCVLGKQDIL